MSWLSVIDVHWHKHIWFLTGGKHSSKRLNISKAQVLYGLGRVAAAREDIEAAIQTGKESLAIFESMEHRTRAEVQAWVSTLDQHPQGGSKTI